MLTQVTTDPSRIIISGHSRGGKLAFTLMDKYAKGSDYTLIAVAGVDPVDGGGPNAGVCISLSFFASFVSNDLRPIKIIPQSYFLREAYVLRFADTFLKYTIFNHASPTSLS